MPKVIVVVPTIRPESHKQFCEAWKPLFEKHQVTLITVWDGEYPAVTINSNIHTGKELTELFPCETEERGLRIIPPITREHHDLFYRFTDGIRNIGFVAATQLMDSPDDILLTMDDDVAPANLVRGYRTKESNELEIVGGDPIQHHINTLNRRCSISWMNTAHEIDLYLRGVPYLIRDEAPVMCSHGVWVGTPDFDGETQLRLEGKHPDPQHPNNYLYHKEDSRLNQVPYSLPYYVGPIPKGANFPVCFVPSAEVTMFDGSRKAISEIREGNRVFTREGKSHKVLRVMETPHCGDVIKIRVAGRDTEVVCTPNHNLWVLRSGHAIPNWVAASEITTDDRMATPVINEVAELSPPNLSTCKLLGYFLAEGNYSKYSPNARHSKAGEYTGLMFTFGTDKKKDAISDCCECLKALGVEYRLEHPKSSATVVVTKTCYDLVALLRDTYYVGEWAHGKKLPKGIYGWDVSRKRALLSAYWAGDGCFSTIERIKGTTQYQCQAKTRSRTMALQIQLLMQSLGFPANVSRLSAYKQSKESWAVSINGTRAKEFKNFLEGGAIPALGKRRHDKAFCEQGFNFYSVKEVSRVKYEGPVYNLTVEDDHTYLVEGLVVKNCGMNLAVKRDAIPYLYFAPMGKDTGIVQEREVDQTAGGTHTFKIPLLNRFADIWMGVALKKEFDKLGWAIYTGASTILHTRASDARNNFDQEKLGREWNEDVWRIMNYQNPRSDVSKEFVGYYSMWQQKRERFRELITSIIEKGGRN